MSNLKFIDLLKFTCIDMYYRDYLAIPEVIFNYISPIAFSVCPIGI